MEVILFTRKVDNFIADLTNQDRIETIQTILLLGSFGHTVSPQYSKKIGKDLFELRIKGEHFVRIFYTFYKGEAYLLHGYFKKTNKIPRHELEYVLQVLKRLA